MMVIVKSKLVPATTGFACSSVLTMRRSATLVTVSDVDAVLSVPTFPAGSVGLATDAELLNTVPVSVEGTVATTVTCT